MSLGLLGGYGSSSEGSDSDEEETKERVPSPVAPSPSTPLGNPFSKGGLGGKSLPKPSFMVEAKDFTKSKVPVAATSTSVFSNPFREREDKKRAVLEKHVTMTVRQEEGKTIGGKKVCWNYRYVMLLLSS